MHRFKRGGYKTLSGFRDEIDKYKLAYRLEAVAKSGKRKAIELYAGNGQLTWWYSRSFENVITVDKDKTCDVQFKKTAEKFIKEDLGNNLDFDYIDFDDEGCPALAIQDFFARIKNSRIHPFVLAVTDGMGLAMKTRSTINFYKHYLQGKDKTQQATDSDYRNFEYIFHIFILRVAEINGFNASEISLYRSDNGNVIYATYLINRNCRSEEGNSRGGS